MFKNILNFVKKIKFKRDKKKLLKNIRLVRKSFKNDSVVLEVLKENGYYLKYAPYNNVCNKEMVLAAVKSEGIVLKYAGFYIQNDKDVVLEAVKQNGFCIHYASDILKNDKDVVLEAVKQNGLSLLYVSESLQNDKELLEVLEKKDVIKWYPEDKIWYYERMNVLENIRNQEEKELMEKSIIFSDKINKALKF